MKTYSCIGTLLLGLTLAGAAAAQEESTGAKVVVEQPSVGFIEATGGYGFQFGEQDYLPTGGGDYKNPLTNGYSVGATAGWTFTPGLALFGNWEYARSNSRDGSVTSALDAVQGVIDYHTIALGLRWTRAIGPGRLYGELAGGVILPFETQIQYDYASGMAAASISGTGTKTDEYNLGVGAYGQLGYQWDLYDRFYLSTALRLKGFQSNNDGKQTRLANFVTDFTAPQAMNMAIDYDSAGPVAPRTYSVQDLRLQVALGFRL